MFDKCFVKSSIIKLICCAFLITTLSISLTGCNIQDIGDFSVNLTGYSKTYTIKDISRTGKNKEELVIPKEINGIQVARLGTAHTPSFHSPNLKKIFWAGDQKLLSKQIIDICPKLDTVVFTSAMPTSYKEFFSKDYAWAFESNNKTNNLMRIILLNEVKEWMIGHEDLYFVPDYVINSPSPNVYFYYNFMNSKNSGYLWIDYLENGERLITLPLEPTREGYEFTGWYIDQICTKKVNLQTIVKDDSVLSFYAGWKEI